MTTKKKGDLKKERDLKRVKKGYEGYFFTG